MASVEAELESREFDKRSETHHGMPRRPLVVMRIITLRDSGLTWQAVGERLGMTRDGACKLYHKWNAWAKGEA